MRKINLTAVCLSLSLLLLFHPQLGTALVSVGYVSEKVCFSVAYQGEVSSYKQTPLFVLPGEEVKIQLTSADPDARLQIDSPEWKQTGHQFWSWKAPRKAGYYPATATDALSGESIALQVFVMVPYAKIEAERLNGYRIGKYPRIPANKQGLYPMPRGFVEITNENKEILLSPHFKLGQFLCKQGGTFPKYVVLREQLLLKLESVLEQVNMCGIPARTLQVMSGYRTPYYNKLLGNVKYSRHMWGDAADIYINSNPSVIGMEDLNGDGRADAEDAEVLYRIVDQLEGQNSFKQLIGGVGLYKPTREHGPFVHIDTRGKQVRWGT